MANLCENKIEITGSKKETFDLLVKGIEENKFLHTIAPVDDKSGATLVDTVVTQKRAWGTRCDLDIDRNITIERDDTSGIFSVSIYADSAWNPPLAALSTLLEKDDSLEIQCDYYEPGCAFVGSWTNGSDQRFDIPNTLEEIEETIPSYLDDMFGISDQLRDELEDEADNATDDEPSMRM